jgi:hypothetical protein
MIIEVIFYVSLIGIVGMLSFKVVEEKLGGVHWWSRFIDSADKKIHQYIFIAGQKYRLWKKIASLFVFDFLPAYLYHQSTKLKDYLYKKYYASQSNLMGSKRMLRGNGSVSEFLQNISKDDVVSKVDDSVEGGLK